MDYEAQLKVQAYLDGELPEGEAGEVAEWPGRDPQTAALLTELRQTKEALAGFEAGIQLPESRDFFWSKIQRQIEREEAAEQPGVAAAPWLVRLRRVLVPAAGVALAVLAGLLLIPTQSAPGMETALADSGAMIYHDYSAGATFVWLPYPAEDDAIQKGADPDLLD